MLVKLAVKNVLTRKSSYIIILFIAFAIMLFCVANALFDSTEQGIESCFTSGFTGDVLIRPEGNSQVSLFGDDTPVTGELTRLECVVPYGDITTALDSLDGVTGFTGQVTSIASMEYNSARTPVYVFGINCSEYSDIMTSLRFVEGSPVSSGERGVMLCKALAEKLGVTLGETVQFTVAEGPSVRIRAAPLTAIVEYEIPNDIFEQFAMADAFTVRSLLDMSNSAGSDIAIAEENENLLSELDDFDDFDSLFDDAFDTDAVWQDIVVEETAELAGGISELDDDTSTSWNFIIVRLKEGASSKKVMRSLNRMFKKNGWPVEAVSWRNAAGSTAMYLYWMRLIFNIGIVIVLAAGFIIINNTLIISVLDRTREFGTMRAVGAGKRFIALQCMIETFMLTLSGGVIGTVSGIWLSGKISDMHILFHNSFLIQLFGSEALSITVTPHNIFLMFLISIVLGLVGWIYPVMTALRVTPVKAMQGAK